LTDRRKTGEESGKNQWISGRALLARNDDLVACSTKKNPYEHAKKLDKNTLGDIIR